MVIFGALMVVVSLGRADSITANCSFTQISGGIPFCCYDEIKCVSIDKMFASLALRDTIITLVATAIAIVAAVVCSYDNLDD